MTNLPSDRGAMEARLARSAHAFDIALSEPMDELYMFLMEVDGEPAGTALLFSRVGEPYGFVNFKMTTLVHASPSIEKRVACDILVLNHDFTGATEVGGLFVDPARRGGGVGRFLARSRYLFLAQSPERFSDTVVAELRGWQEPDGRQPFWEAVGHRFFDMDFHEADLMNARLGNHFIADLMPQYPIYVAMLPEDARACIARTHENGAAAYKMLLAEGFRYTRYVDIFDGGPVVSAARSDIRTIRESRLLPVSSVDDAATEPRLLASGAGKDFRSTFAPAVVRDDSVVLSGAAAKALRAEAGSSVRIL